ncbi:MAG: hypothetical protein HY301_18495 [Verrucomicrobia bacterium]|nr:hypothetical protein [Verrucomicrobiota bacterium]
MKLRTTLCLWLAALALAPAAEAPKPKAAVVTNEVRLDPAATNRDALLQEVLRRAMTPASNTPGPVPSIPMSALPLTNRPVRSIQPNALPTATTPAVPAVPTAPPAFPTTPVAPPASPRVAVPATTPAAATAPGIGAAKTAAPATAAPPVAAPPEELLDPTVLQFQAMDLDPQFLDFYAKVVGKTLLRPAGLPAVKITIKTQSQLTRTEVIQMFDHVLALNGVTTVAVGEKFMEVIPSANAAQAGAKFNSRDAKDLPEAAQYLTQIIQLKYVRPSQILTVISPFARAANAIIPVEDSGVLVIRDYAINVKRIMEIIEKVDVTSPLDITSELIPIKYALASDIASVLGSLTGQTTAMPTSSRNTGIPGTPSGTSVRRAGVGATGSFGAGGAGGAGGYNPAAGGAGGVGGLGNTGGVGGAGALGGGAGGTSSAFQARLAQIVNRASQGGGGIQLLGEVKIIPDERTNSILVFASRADLEQIKEIIAKLDVVLAQVLIEAMILDVTLGDDFNLSFTAGQHPQPLAGGSVLGGVVNNGGNKLGGGSSFLNQLMQSFVTNVTPAGITNITSVFSSVTNVAFPTSDGLSYFGRLNQSWDFAMTASAGDNNIKVLARPRIQTSHAVPAAIFVGETRPYVTGTSFNNLGGGGSQSQYQQTQIGITLNVLPLINKDGLVVMDIQQQVQQVGGSVRIDNNDVPITQDQNASAKVAVNDRETIVLGGFIRDQKTETKSGVPYLKDIPLLGYLFRSTSTSNGRRELVVLIRPTVLPTPEAAALRAKEVRNEMPTLKITEREIMDKERRLQRRAAEDDRRFGGKDDGSK